MVSSSPWANAAIVATALGALVFVVSYAATTGGMWRKSAVGRNAMSLMAAILAVSLLAVAGIVFGTDWPHRELIRTASWGVIAATIWHRVWVLYRVQHPERSDTPT